MLTFDFDWARTWPSLGKLCFAYVLTLPIGWDREREAHTAGLRTFPIVAMAACGCLLIMQPDTGSDLAAQSRVLQGLITGIGFVGGGAILKEGFNVRGTATAASIWNTGVLGAAVALGRYEVAIALAVLNFFTLKALAPIKNKLDQTPDEHEKKSIE